MEPNTVAAIVAAIAAFAAAVAAFVALKPAQRAARAAEDQTAIQQDLKEQSAQPYVWADIQPDMQQGTMLHLVLGNSGPTMARNVRIIIDPPIPDHPKYSGKTAIAQKRSSDGILSLAPGRTIRWSLGRGFDLLEEEDDQTIYSLRVSADGPYGALEPVVFEIRPSDWREARDAPDGNLHFVRKAIENLANESRMIRQQIQSKDISVVESSEINESSLSDAIVRHREADRDTAEDSAD